MDGKLNIVPGEAPESDDEDIGATRHMTVLQGRAIQGEAPESDSSSSEIDEAEDGQRGGSVGNVSSAASALSLASPTSEHSSRPVPHKEDVRHNSLLHKKLRERNASLRRSVEDFVHQTVQTAARDLNSIDQHLLRSQVTLQEAATSLRLLQSNLSQIHSKLSLATSFTHLPAINVNNL